MNNNTPYDAYRIASSILAWSGDKERTLDFACRFASERTWVAIESILSFVESTSKTTLYKS